MIIQHGLTTKARADRGGIHPTQRVRDKNRDRHHRSSGHAHRRIYRSILPPGKITLCDVINLRPARLRSAIVCIPALKGHPITAQGNALGNIGRREPQP